MGAKKINFGIDVSSFKLFGRELITDNVTAVFELVKNSYDAGASIVELYFDNDKVIITDNGCGMNEKDIVTNWATIGTSYKRINKKINNRRVSGEKGIGRFAVEKLGDAYTIITKKRDEDNVSKLTCDWEEFSNLTKAYEINPELYYDPRIDNIDYNNKIKKKFFTDIEMNLETIEGSIDINELTKNEPSFTSIIIEKLKVIWTKTEINHLVAELAKFKNPLIKDGDFKINITHVNESQFDRTEVVSNDLTAYSKMISLNNINNEQEFYVFNDNEGLVKKLCPTKIFGPVSMVIYYFDKDAKRAFKNMHLVKIDGIKIYRDNVLTTPFAESNSNDNQKRDILGVDKRRYSGFFDKLSSRDIIGYVFLTKDSNPMIVESTNRQDFIENEQYIELKKFIIEQLQALEQSISKEKDENISLISKNITRTSNKLNDILSGLVTIKQDAPDNLAIPLDELFNSTKKLQFSLSKGVEELEEYQKAKVRQENLFLSLVSLQEFALDMSHMIRSAISRFQSRLEFIAEYISDEAHTGTVVGYAKQLSKEIARIELSVDFLMSYSKANLDITTFSIKDLLDNLIKSLEMIIVDTYNIDVYINIPEILFTHNYKFIEDIFENLLSNSIKALRSNKGKKIISIQGVIIGKALHVKFSDNGQGIKLGDEERIFNLYYSTTQDQGGAGLGLYVVRKRLSSINGHISVVNPIYTPGASFEVILPFS